MKKIIILCMVFLSVTYITSCKATEISNEDVYNKYFEISGADNLTEALPNDVKDELEEYDILNFDGEFSNKFNPENVFESIFCFIKSKGKRPIIAGCSILAILLFSSAFGGLFEKNKSINFVVTLGIVAAAVIPAASTVVTCGSVIKSVSIFMLSFVPIFAGVLILSGKSLSAAGYSSIMLFSSEAVSYISSFFVLPLISTQLSLSVGSSLLNEIDTSSVNRAIKRVSMWILSLMTTILLGILGVQTLVNGSSDSLALKTTKFLVGTTVPIVGTAVSEAISTVTGCIKILNSSVAVFGIVALALMILPIIIELLLYRVVLLITSSLADMLSLKKASELIKSIDSTYAFSIGILILVSALFIISITMVAMV